MTIDEIDDEIELEDEVDDTGRNNGVVYVEGEPLRVGPKESDRDRHRWELDPASADDYVERMHQDPDEAEPVRHMAHVHRKRRD